MSKESEILMASIMVVIVILVGLLGVGIPTLQQNAYAQNCPPGTTEELVPPYSCNDNPTIYPPIYPIFPLSPSTGNAGSGNNNCGSGAPPQDERITGSWNTVRVDQNIRNTGTASFNPDGTYQGTDNTGGTQIGTYTFQDGKLTVCDQYGTAYYNVLDITTNSFSLINPATGANISATK